MKVEMFRKLRQDERGVAAGVIGLVIVLIMFAVALPIGLIITANLQSTVTSMGLTGTANTTATNLFTNIYSAFNLSVILPIVAAAGMVITTILLYFRFRGD